MLAVFESIHWVYGKTSTENSVDIIPDPRQADLAAILNMLNSANENSGEGLLT